MNTLHSISTMRRWPNAKCARRWRYATNREEIIRYLIPRPGACSRTARFRQTAGPTSPASGATHTIRNRRNVCWTRPGFRRQPETGGMRLKLTLKTSTRGILAAAGPPFCRSNGARSESICEVRPMEFATLFSDMARGSFQIFTLRWIGGEQRSGHFFDYVFGSKMIPPAGRQSRPLPQSGNRCAARPGAR